MQYYLNFISAYPNVHSLALAAEDEVFKLWEGLGYYTRCRNLLHTARQISLEFDGVFPNQYDEIRKLKGIGPYTAAAISSFAFNLPHAVLDGNVFRVLARIFGDFTPTDTTEGKKRFASLAAGVLDQKEPARFNQAIMDFGATICKPVPQCDSCPFNKSCHAFLNNQVSELPIRLKKNHVRLRWFYYFIIEHKGMVAIRQRTAKDIWQQLYEYPLIETVKELADDEILSWAMEDGLIMKNHVTLKHISPSRKQQLSHQLILGKFIRVAVKKLPAKEIDWIWLPEQKLDLYAFPRFINSYRESQGTPSFT